MHYMHIFIHSNMHIHTCFFAKNASFFFIHQKSCFISAIHKSGWCNCHGTLLIVLFPLRLLHLFFFYFSLWSFSCSCSLTSTSYVSSSFPPVCSFSFSFPFFLPLNFPLLFRLSSSFVSSSFPYSYLFLFFPSSQLHNFLFLLLLLPILLIHHLPIIIEFVLLS